MTNIGNDTFFIVTIGAFFMATIGAFSFLSYYGVANYAISLWV
jgi:hypothetical protein